MQALGVALEDGEQLFYVYETNMKQERLIGGLIGGGLVVFRLISMWFVCFTILFIPLGGWIAYKAISPSKDAMVAMLLTDQRIIALPFDASAAPDEVPLSELEDVECKRMGRKVTHKRGLAAAAINVAAQAIKEHQQNKQAKSHPNYWSGATELHLVLSGGRMKKWNMEQSEGPNLGPLLGTGLVRGWDSLVAVSGAPEVRTLSLL